MVARSDASASRLMTPARSPGNPMLKPFAMLLLLIPATALCSAELQVVAGDGTAYVLTHPDTVTASVNHPPAGIPPTVRIRSKSGGMSLEITFMPVTGKEPATQEALNVLVGQIGVGQYEG